MKKKLLSFILAFLLCVSLVPAALADSDKSIVYDQEELFDEFDTEIISGKLAELNRIYGVDVAVVTASSLDGKTAVQVKADSDGRASASLRQMSGTVIVKAGNVSFKVLIK